MPYDQQRAYIFWFCILWPGIAAIYLLIWAYKEGKKGEEYPEWPMHLVIAFGWPLWLAGWLGWIIIAKPLSFPFVLAYKFGKRKNIKK